MVSRATQIAQAAHSARLQADARGSSVTETNLGHRAQAQNTMESFDGLAILATNLRANLDDALLRRLDLIVDFPMPDATLRRGLWDRCLGRRIPRAADLDLDFCAAAFELSGGNIRSAVVSAAYLAAKDDRSVSTADLVAGVYQEYRKLGRLTLETEFGQYLARLR